MNEKIALTVIILTYNEELNINQSLSNVIDWVEEVIVLDSGSTDNTCKIAENMGATIYFRKFDNYANQRNYAIQQLPIKTEWILFLDADEYLTPELKEELKELFLKNKGLDEIDGFYIKRKFYFLGSWIRFGGYYPTWLLRLFKKEKGICTRNINEHIEVRGATSKLKYDFVDKNHKNFASWIEKHNKYSTLEANELIKSSLSIEEKEFQKLWGSQAQKKRWIRQNIWQNIPPLIRPFFYFFYRYILRLGFLDGRIGFIFHFMQGFVYRMMIDIKYLETKLKSKSL